MPRQRTIFANGREYNATEHGIRDDGLRQPQYILLGEAVGRLAKFGESSKHFYFGYYETNRISFEMEGSWWYIDDEQLYQMLKNPRTQVRFTT